MDKISFNIFIIVTSILLMIVNYLKIFITTRGIYQVSGVLLFKYFFRLLIILIFSYLAIDFDKSRIENNQKRPSIAFVLPSNQITSHDYMIKFRNFVLNDLKKSEENIIYNLVKYNSLNGQLYKILPDLNKTQLLEILTNNNIQNLQSFPQKIDLNLSSKTAIMGEELLKFGIYKNQIYPITKDENRFLKQFQSNNLNITFNLKVYLLFLLIIFLASDLLFSLKIIKI